MKFFSKKTKRTISTLLLSVTLLFGFLDTLSNLLESDAICQPLNEDDLPPISKPTTSVG